MLNGTSPSMLCDARRILKDAAKWRGKTEHLGNNPERVRALDTMREQIIAALCAENKVTPACLERLSGSVTLGIHSQRLTTTLEEWILQFEEEFRTNHFRSRIRLVH